MTASIVPYSRFLEIQQGRVHIIKEPGRTPLDDPAPREVEITDGEPLGDHRAAQSVMAAGGADDRTGREPE